MEDLRIPLNWGECNPNSAFYKHFRTEMRAVGTEQFTIDGLSRSRARRCAAIRASSR